MIELIKHENNKFFEQEQTNEVIKLAMKLADNGRLRQVFDNDEEIAYWYAPEVATGVTQISKRSDDEYKTVSLRMNKDEKNPGNLTDGEYKEVLKNLTKLSSKIKINHLDLFAILGEDNNNQWVVSTDKKNRPYVYSTLSDAVKTIKRFGNQLRNEENPRYGALKIMKFTPLRPNFAGSLLIDSFYTIKTDNDLYFDENLNPTDSIDNALVFESDSNSELIARQTADDLGGHIALYETREVVNESSRPN